MNEDEIEVIKNIKLALEMTGDMPRLVFSRNDIECMLNLIDKQQKEIERLKNLNKNTYIRKDTIKELREIYNIDLIQFKLKKILGE